MAYRIDVRRRGRLIQEGVWELPVYEASAIYWDAREGRYMGSIGRNVWTGRVFAALDARFHDDPNYDCLYLGS